MGIEQLQYNTVAVATPSEVDRIREPELIFTDNYLNDPIRYRADDRFRPHTVVQQFPELPSQLKRDFAEFLQIDRNDDRPQLLTISMFSNVADRVLYKRVMGDRSEFSRIGITQVGNTR